MRRAYYGIDRERDVMVPMRDGVRLATDLCLPKGGGRFPTIVQRTPYGKANVAPLPMLDRSPLFASHGYAMVVQDVRGRFGSEGRWRPLVDDVDDGFDTLAWIGRQPWSNGRVGTIGTSYVGGTQHALALSGAPELAAMVPVDAMSNPGHFGIRYQGAFELRWLNWILTLGNPFVNAVPAWPFPMRRFYPSQDPEALAGFRTLEQDVTRYARELPRRGKTPLRAAPDYEDWLIGAIAHGANDEFWTSTGMAVVDRLDEYKDVPVLHVSGWYDSWGASVATQSYPALVRAKRSPQHLLLGPWTHGGQELRFAGEADFGPDAALDFSLEQLRWFDRFLGERSPAPADDPPVRIFVMGGGDGHRTPAGRVFVGGHWRSEREWPLARARSTRFFLHAGGRLSREAPHAASPTRFRFDPADPVPSLGGNVSSQGPLMSSGALDQRCRPELWHCAGDRRRLAERADVCVFQTEPLEEPIEVTGPIEVELFAHSSARDTDFTAKLVDVWPPNQDFPDGVELNVADGIVRARYREGGTEPVFLEPGQPTRFTIHMYPTSLVFGRGHRIRIDVSSSNFPRFDVNPNTGEPLGAHTHTEVAEQAIHHDPDRPSHVLLPVIPGDDAPPTC